MKLVLDASVAVKWIVPDAAAEADTDRAAQILDAIREGRVEPVQPPHWLAEVAAVISRLRPEVANRAIDLLEGLELAVEADAEIYKRASHLATRLDQHLFDTLYHAVALERGAVLVTADDRYFRKAGSVGAVVSLSDWTLQHAG